MLSAAEVAIKAGDQQLAQGAVLTALANMDVEGIDELLEWCRKRGLDLVPFKPTQEDAKATAEAAQGQEPDPITKVAEHRPRNSPPGPQTLA